MATSKDSSTSRKEKQDKEAARPAADAAATPAATATEAASTAGTPAAGPRVKWNVEQLKSSYVNFANANSTREEVVLNFGLNQNWDRTQQQVEIDLLHRVVMSPFAAKRLSEVLGKLLAEYQARYGELK